MNKIEHTVTHIRRRMVYFFLLICILLNQESFEFIYTKSNFRYQTPLARPVGLFPIWAPQFYFKFLISTKSISAKD